MWYRNQNSVCLGTCCSKKAKSQTCCVHKAVLGRCRIGRVICRKGMDNSTKGISNEARNARVKTTSWGMTSKPSPSRCCCAHCAGACQVVSIVSMWSRKDFSVGFFVWSKNYEFIWVPAWSCYVILFFEVYEGSKHCSENFGFFGSRSAPHIARRALEVLWFLEAPPTSMRWTHLHGYGRSQHCRCHRCLCQLLWRGNQSPKAFLDVKGWKLKTGMLNHFKTSSHHF